MPTGLANAMVEYGKFKAKTNATNEVVQATIPADPKRGSYFWWVALCRQNTGQHFLDSGSAYGYTYNSGYLMENDDPVSVEFWRGVELTTHIHLPHWLCTTFDAADPIAEALEQLLYWVSEWVYPKEPWGRCTSELLDELAYMRPHLWYRKDGTPVFRKRLYGIERMRLRYDEMTRYDKARYQQEFSREEYITQALEGFPVKAIKTIEETGIHDDVAGRGFNTYNHDCDLDQTIQVDCVLEDEYGESYAIIRTHNGADVRGGYSSPVVARANEECYMYSWLADLWCRECDSQWEMAHFYGREMEKVDVPGQVEVEALKAKLEVVVAVANGQIGFMDPPEITDEERAIVAFYESWLESGEEAEDFKYPLALIETDNGLMAPDVDGYKRYPGIKTRVLCPNCMSYGVCVGSLGL